MSMPGPLELGLIFLVVLLLFGARRIPEIARGLGQGIREFKKSMTGITKDTEEKPAEKPSEKTPKND